MKTFDPFFRYCSANLAQILVEDHDPVPLGLFLALAGRLVAPAFRRRHAQICHRPPILGAADFGIGAQIADQDHFIDAACHDLPRLRTRSVRSVSIQIRSVSTNSLCSHATPAAVKRELHSKPHIRSSIASSAPPRPASAERRNRGHYWPPLPPQGRTLERRRYPHAYRGTGRDPPDVLILFQGRLQGVASPGPSPSGRGGSASALLRVAGL